MNIKRMAAVAMEATAPFVVTIKQGFGYLWIPIIFT